MKLKAGKMAQQEKEPAAKPDKLSSFPGTHAAEKADPQVVFCAPLHVHHGICVHAHT